MIKNKLQSIIRFFKTPLGWAVAAAPILTAVACRALAAVFGSAPLSQLSSIARARLEYVLLALFWLGALAVFPFYFCRSIGRPMMIRRTVRGVTIVFLVALAAAAFRPDFSFLKAALCMAVCVVLMAGVCWFLMLVLRRSLESALIVAVTWLLLFGMIFWMNPFLDRLDPGGRSVFIKGVMHLAPLPVLGEVFDPQKVRPLTNFNFSYYYSQLALYQFEYPLWWKWLLVNGCLACGVWAVNILTQRRQRRPPDANGPVGRIGDHKTSDTLPT